MGGSDERHRAIEQIGSYTSLPGEFAEPDAPADLFGRNVFSKSVMQARLPRPVFESVQATIEQGEPLDPSVADAVAAAMKDWAIEHGATHYAHVFYPLTGLTAEKHDSFLEPDASGGGAIAEFAGKTLVQGEPDASSFPHGGLRETFEARGYTGWDATSPAYILENPNGNTLCIPTIFVSWTGDALDKKVPLLRSQQVLNTQVQRVLRLFGHEEPAPVTAFVGAEQEYFLIDRRFFLQRPDLLATGRTLFGAAPPKGQEFDDHYFGAIPERVLAFMLETERELFKLGIPAKTRHNEVAPGQFELAPLFERANIATDHQQQLMATLRRVAEKYDMECLLHEKPFAGVNGSGKHVNYSFGNATQGNLLNPGATPHENAQFLVFCAAVIRGVHKYGGLLRAVVASSRNDHRLGANEAPPAIISIFLGEQLTDVFDQIVKGGATASKERSHLVVGVDTLPALPKDPGDRNRTSPFAFTGNRFEFRAPGSSMSIAGPLVALNTIVADSLDVIATRLEAALAEGTDFNEAVQSILQDLLTEHGSVVFNGDGYSEEWQIEAAARGLPNLRTTVDALPELARDEVVELFERHHVLSERELSSRLEVYLEQYVMSVQVEGRSAVEVASTFILPAAMRYQGELAGTAANLARLGREPDLRTLDRVSDCTSDLSTALDELRRVLDHSHDRPTIEVARHMCDVVLPAMERLRSAADSLEEVVADDLWPLPTYQEMLFVL